MMYQILYRYALPVLMFHLSSGINGNRIQVEERVLPVNVCNTVECIHEGKVIHENRNDSVKPCDNFYEFVCGGWEATHPTSTSSNGFSRNQYWDLNHLNIARVKDILETQGDTQELDFAKKAKTFYQSCLNRDEHAERNFQIVKQRMDTWGGWPIATEHWSSEKFDWKKLLIHLLRTNDLHPLFRIYVSLDYRNTSRAGLMIDQADGKFCPHHESSAGEQLLESAILQTALKIANETNENVSEEKMREDVTRLIRLESQICKTRRKRKGRTDLNQYTTKTVRQLQNLTDGVEIVNEFAQFKWIKLLNDYLQGSSLKIDENEEIVVLNPNYISEIVQLIDNTPQRTLASYMLWYHLEWMGTDEWIGFLEDDSEQENSTRPNGKANRWKRCAQEADVYFQHGVGYQFAQIYFDENTKKKAKELVQNILDSFVEDLQKNKWMDERTRTQAVQKAKNMKVLVGYPDWYNTTEINKRYQEYVMGDNYLINLENIKKIAHREFLDYFDGTDKEIDYWPQLTDVNAYHYEPDTIVVPAGIFQAPFYVKGRPEALNYGGIGTVIGHELSHSFDVVGRKYDKFGILRNWWTAETLKIHNSKKYCIQELYSSFPTPELKDERAWRLDGVGSVGENMADIGGLEMALASYKKYLSVHGPEKKIPGFSQYSSEQLFFIGYVTTLCETSTNEYVAAVILTDEHTPNKYSGMITVANSKEFSEAWKCKEEDKMNAPRKCQFW